MKLQGSVTEALRAAQVAAGRFNAQRRAAMALLVVLDGTDPQAVEAFLVQASALRELAADVVAADAEMARRVIRDERERGGRAGAD